MDISKLDWKSLEFTCTPEQNPPVDPEADRWNDEARALQKRGGDVPEQEVFRLFTKAAERGHYKAYLNLSRLYVEGEGVPRDTGKAVDLVERALKLNAPHAYYLMGVMLQQGIGVREDRAASLAYFRKAADLGNKYGQWTIGEQLLKVFAQQSEPARSRGRAIGLQMLECALGQGLAEAGHKMGLDYLIGEEDTYTALRYFQMAGALGLTKSLYTLYSIFDEGTYGLEKDPKRAACYDPLWRAAHADPNLRFPDLDTQCPLPPAPAKHSESDQTAPRAGLWRATNDPNLMFRAALGDILPRVEGATLRWEWTLPLAGKQVPSGQPCPWPGFWACEDFPTGEKQFAYGQTMPTIEGRTVTWRLTKGS
ncbi:putative beta-lactamase HcpC precursor [compost metagenome]